MIPIIVLILCGGKGTRLQPVLKDMPKCLAPLWGEPFLEHTLEWLESFQITQEQVTLSVSPQTLAPVQTEFPMVMTHMEDHPLGTGGAPIDFVREMDVPRTWDPNTLLVLNGDTLFDFDLAEVFNWHQAWQSSLTVVCRTVYDYSMHEYDEHRFLSMNPPPLGTHALKDSIPEMSELYRGHRIEYVHEQRGQTTPVGFHPEPAGAFLFDMNILRQCSPHGFVGNMEYDLIPFYLMNGLPCWSYGRSVEFFDIGTPERYEEVQGHQERVSLFQSIKERRQANKQTFLVSSWGRKYSR